MTVPEAAMHEADGSEPAKDKVRRSGELPIVKAVPEAARMERAAKDQLWFRVPAADSRHHSRPDRLINYIGHELACIAKEEQDRACISQNVVDAIKEDRVIVRRTALAGSGHPKVPDTVPDRCPEGQSQRCRPVSHIVARGSRLLGHPPGKRLRTHRTANDQP